jgi:hypothetical protein
MGKGIVETGDETQNVLLIDIRCPGMLRPVATIGSLLRMR